MSGFVFCFGRVPEEYTPSAKNSPSSSDDKLQHYIAVTMPVHDSLLIFTRYPIPGEVKTRLIPFLGAEKSAQLHREMTEFTLRQARQINARVEVRFTGAELEQMREWLGRDIAYCDQGPGDLGRRMARAVQEHFAGGARRVVVIGSDCPENRAANLRLCFALLQKHPCVLGPAHDGGYYLIGMNEARPELFSGVDWGAGHVLRQTLTAAPPSTALLPKLHDVDREEDVPSAISVVIPALNEEKGVAGAVRSVRQGFHAECIVVDGGSKDATRLAAAEAGAEVLQSPPGRARQMNYGAKHAQGEILLFLHADSSLPEGWDIAVRNALKTPGTALGAFTFYVPEKIAGMKLVAWGVDMRSRLFHMPYGDQGLFLQRALFEKVGGFPDIPIMEDVALVKKAKQHGKIVIVKEKLATSGRRWQQHGIVKTLLLNQYILLASAFGVSPERLREIYRAGALMRFFR